MTNSETGNQPCRKSIKEPVEHSIPSLNIASLESSRFDSSSTERKIPAGSQNMNCFDGQKSGASGDSCLNFSDKELLHLAKHIGIKHEELGLELGLTYSEVQVACASKPGNAVMQGFEILRSWRHKQRRKASLAALVEAMRACGIDTHDIECGM